MTTHWPDRVRQVHELVAENLRSGTGPILPILESAGFHHITTPALAQGGSLIVRYVTPEGDLVIDRWTLS